MLSSGWPSLYLPASTEAMDLNCGASLVLGDFFFFFFPLSFALSFDLVFMEMGELGQMAGRLGGTFGKGRQSTVGWGDPVNPSYSMLVRLLDIDLTGSRISSPRKIQLAPI